MSTEVDNDQDLDEDLDQDEQEHGEDSGEAGVKEEADGSVTIDTAEAEAKTDEDRERIRADRRAQRQEQKQRKREKDDRLRRELASEKAERVALQERLAIIERKTSGGEMAQLDGAINQARNNYAYYKNALAGAIDGNVRADATEKMILAKQKFDELNGVKRAYEQRQKQPAPLNPQMVQHATSFMEKNPWYNQGGRDSDSLVMRSIDDALVTEGWNPATKEYWDELEARKRKYLPHRNSGSKVSSNNTIDRTKSIVSGSGRESAAPSSAGVFKLSAERVNAIKEAGMWNDPKKRAEMVDYYRKFDREQKRN